MPGDERFARAMSRVVAALPFGLSRVVPPSLVGFALLNALTFSLDLGLLTTFHGDLRLAATGQHHHWVRDGVRAELLAQPPLQLPFARAGRCATARVRRC